MSSIINLDDYRAKVKDDRIPHKVKYIACMSCAHDWVAAVPKDVTIYECPECKKMEGEEVNYHDQTWFERFIPSGATKKQLTKRTMVLLNAKRMGL
jgi:hypothetical protein